MQSCDTCLYTTTHPFQLTFENGLCSGCRTHIEKNQIDWSERRENLEDLLKSVKKKKTSYDCVIPVIGDAEDYFVLSKVLDLGMAPLVVCVNDYFKNDIGWYNFHNLITHFDVDSIVYNPDWVSYRELVRTSLRKYDHVLLPFLQLHTSFPVHIALQKNIPIVIWGQCQAIEQVGKFSHLDAVQMSRWSRREHDLFNTEIDDLIGNGAQLNERTLNYYRYPDVNKIYNKGIIGIYLSNYFRWDPLPQNKSSLELKFKPELNTHTFDPYERSGSSVYYKIHDLLKLKRTGYRKVSDHLTREVRHNRITPIDGKEILSNFENPVFIKPFFDWLGVTKSGYDWFVAHRLGELKDSITRRELESDFVFLRQHANLSELVNVELHEASDHFIPFSKGI